MRSGISAYKNYLFILFFLSILSNVLITVSSAQDNQLYLYITDNDGYPIEEVEEEQYFTVSVYTLNEIQVPTWETNVALKFNDISFIIDESAEVVIQAPVVNFDKIFYITASKEGFNSTNKTIIILNNLSKKLDISTVDVVDGGKLFSVYVYDEKGEPVPNAIVGISSILEESDETDDAGRAWLTAPENKDTIMIIAQKNGYVSDNIIIKVNIPQHWWETFIKSQYFPIIIAFIFLILAIIFVNQRQKKSIFARAKEISDNKTIEKFNKNEKSVTPISNKINEKTSSYSSLTGPVRIKSNQDSKVEEIRISRYRKDKEIVPVDEKKDETEKIINRKKKQKHDYDWFEGKDHIRYEIDKITGEIDEKGMDKWYEGVDGLKEKINEKVKNKDKKKNS
ncbi:hypothetical protein AYK24_05095 [Thermoplasmatales archaeon SG8-52-4]|nr:MAG: hypothetical protein AYK24_05095 [Thermoplasmatales archaeon SG8-52-4]